jgi:uncharacterized membrane protein
VLRAARGEPGRVGLPTWVVPASLALALVGLGLSIYLTVEHYSAPGSLVCPVGDGVDCARVTTSAQSKLLFIPVAVLGIVFFVAMLALCLPQVWTLNDPRVWKTRIAAAAAGMVFVIYLIFAEIFIVEAYCLWCTGVHIVTFALFSVIVMGTALSDLDRR